ncbi:MAG: tetratricopeptide repeat protein [Planctomycetes bacterium]|nr:tetratricopeptide repeat protein [Planctomycetota bacterium]
MTPATANRVLPPLAALVLALATAAAYWPALANGFVAYDDDVYVTANAEVQAGPGAETLRWAFSAFRGGNWHPLTWISHALDCRLHGQEPRGHHLTSVLLHAANAGLFLLLLWRLTGEPVPAALAAALWAAHPLRVESVAWVAERKDVLSGTLGLLALLAYAWYRRRPGPPRYAAVAALHALGLMAKPMLVTLPLLFVLLDLWPLARMPRPRLVWEKGPLLALSVASCVVTVLAQRRGGALGGLEAIPLGARLDNALVACLRYLGKTLWPADLAVFYPHPGASLPSWQPLAAALLLAALTAALLRHARRDRAPLVGWLWFLGALVPVLGLVQVGQQSMADRYTYLPSMGLAAGLVWGARSLGRPRLLTAVGLATLAALVPATRAQIAVWRDTRSLFEWARAATSGNWLAHNKLAHLAAREGRWAEAAGHYETALGLNPRHGHTRAGLGRALAGLAAEEMGRAGATPEVLARFARAEELAPEDPEVRNNHGLALVLAGRRDEAIPRFREALRLRPGFVDALNNWGVALMRSGRYEEAVDRFEEALALDPDHPRLRANLEEARRRGGP